MRPAGKSSSSFSWLYEERDDEEVVDIEGEYVSSCLIRGQAMNLSEISTRSLSLAMLEELINDMPDS